MTLTAPYASAILWRCRAVSGDKAVDGISRLTDFLLRNIDTYGVRMTDKDVKAAHWHSASYERNSWPHFKQLKPTLTMTRYNRCLSSDALTGSSRHGLLNASTIHARQHLSESAIEHKHRENSGMPVENQSSVARPPHVGALQAR